MLNADHVRARRDKDRLVLTRLTEPKRRRAVELAEQIVEVARSALGASRAELDEAYARVEVAPAERRLMEGLVKLVEDASEFEEPSAVDPAALRSELFLRAATARRSATIERPFVREAVLAEAAQALGLAVEAVEEGLFSDLRSAQRMTRAPVLDGEALVARYEQAQVQAVLLRAVEVVARVRCRTPDRYRELFQKLKFRKLLYRIEQHSEGAYSITIDGPFSLFEAVTKYGLELALTLPALEACDTLELTARVLWGKGRTPLRFEHRHTAGTAESCAAVVLRDEVQTLLDEFRELGTGWEVGVSEAILELPGSGLCVPDLVFRRKRGGSPIYLEVLGYWSREAVFRRLDLARQGLGHPIVFAVSSRLRVSEALIEGDEPAALYVYRGKPSARALERKLTELANRTGA